MKQVENPTKNEPDSVGQMKLEKISMGHSQESDGRIWYKPDGYFTCPDEVKRIFGHKPVALRIQFPGKDSRDWVRYYYRLYSANGTTLCAGDGESAIENMGYSVRNKLTAADIKPISCRKLCSPNDCPNFRLGACRTVMYLYFLIPECSDSLYYLQTMSPISIRNITCFHRKFQDYRKLNHGISMYLKVKKVDDSFLSRPNYALDLSLSSDIHVKTSCISGITSNTVVVLPEPSQDPPDDFFPHCIETESKDIRQQIDEEALLEQWARLKNRMFHYTIQSDQIARWFSKHYHLDIDITDFDMAKPPKSVTSAMLSRLIHSIECHTVS